MGTEEFQKADEAKRQAVLRAAIAEFSQKSFTEASTEHIAANGGISKGLLFYYFGTKAELYLYCLSEALRRLIEPSPLPQGDFFAILFGVMDEKLRICAKYPEETRFVNMASRENSDKVRAKGELFAEYYAKVQTASAESMRAAVASLKLSRDSAFVIDGLNIYVNALMSRYLLRYQNAPEDFFADAEKIKQELREYVELMLYGIVK